MKAIQFKEYGNPEVLQMVDVPIPSIRPGYVLVISKGCWCKFR